MQQSSPGVFGRLAAFVMSRPRAVAAFILISSLVCALSATRLKVDPDLLKLLPKDDPTTQAVLELNRQEGGVNLLTISVEGPKPEVVDEFMHELTERLEAMDDVGHAIYDIEPELAWQIGLRQLSPSDLANMRDRLKAALALGPAAQNPMIAGRLLDLGPLTEKLKASGSSGAFASAGGVARVLVRPVGSAQDTTFARKFMAQIYALLDEMDPAARGLKVAWIGGPYRHNVEDLEGIIFDLRWTVIASSALVFLLIGGAFRDSRAILLIFTPLVVGNLWTMGFAVVAVGTLNTFTSFFFAILIGLGVDFSIHLYARYREQRARGGELEDAVVRAWDLSGPPCLTAALTSAAGFCALWVAGFRGFQQLGTLLAGGVMLCLLAVLLALPLLILWREKRPTAVPLRQAAHRGPYRPPTYRLAPLGLLLTILVTVIAALQLNRVEFQYDLSELRRTGLAYSDLGDQEQELVEDSYAPVVVSYPDEASLAADHERLSKAVEEGRFPEVGRVLSIFTVLPTRQDEQVAVLQELSELARNPAVVYLPPPVQLNLQKIASSEQRVLTPEDLPESMRYVLGSGGDHHRLLLFPSGNQWDLRETVALHDAVERWVGEMPYAGPHLALGVLYKVVRQDAPRVTLVALVSVFGFCLVDLRSLKRALGACAALLAGICWAGAAMGIFQIKLSIMNFVGIPILMGIGIDVIIHLLHRITEEGPGRIMRALTTTGWAAALSTATTVLSFASLSVASNQGIRTLGLVIVLGLTLVSAAAFAAIPLGWMTAWKIRGDIPDNLDTGEVPRT